MKRDNKGTITIEAIISLSCFIFAFLCISSLSTLARCESKIQYALNQTAKEFSQYTYIFYRAGLYEEDIGAKRKSVDDLIQETSDFTEMVKTASTNSTTAVSKVKTDLVNKDFTSAIGTIKESSNNVKVISESSKSLINKYKSAAENPTQILQGIYDIVGKEVKDGVVSKVVSPVVCNLLMPKYLESDEMSADEFLKNMGVENGMGGLNFMLSSVLEDGKSINLTAVYTVKYKWPIIGDFKFTIKQTASTAGWTKGAKLINIKTNVWNFSPKNRGKLIADKVRKENEALVLKSGEGYSSNLYDKNTNTFIDYTSVDPNNYLATYDGLLGVDDTKFKKQITKYCDQLQSDLKLEKVKMADGKEYEIPKDTNGKIIVYVPDNTIYLEVMQRYCSEVASKYENITIDVQVLKGE